MPFTNAESPSWEPLIQAAWTARSHAYAPYSGFLVGAALIDLEGHITSGCNVENASFGGTLCAERAALSAAVGHGLRPGSIQALVVVTEAEVPTPPCGLCRQVIAEFAEDIPVLLVNPQKRILHRSSQLLPHAFSGRNLHGVAMEPMESLNPQSHSEAPNAH